MATMMTQPRAITPSVFEAELIRLQEGVRANLPPGVSLTIEGATLEQAAIMARLDGWLATFEAVARAKQAHEHAVAARLGITVEARTFEKSLKRVLKNHFGPQSGALASFGIAADKPIATTLAQKALAIARRAQTRAARGTLGKRQRLPIAGAGAPPAVVPPTPARTLAEAHETLSPEGLGEGAPR
jgi:hypothetical protein